MKFVIEHLSKHFEKKEVLRDVNFSFGKERRRKDDAFQLSEPGFESRWGKVFPGGEWRGTGGTGGGYRLCPFHAYCAGVFDRQGVLEIFHGYQREDDPKSKNHR